MQPDLIGTNQTKEIDSNVFCQLLQFRSCDLFTSKHYVNEYGGIVAPVETNMVIDSPYEGIARVLQLQPIDPV